MSGSMALREEFIPQNDIRIAWAWATPAMGSWGPTEWARYAAAGCRRLKLDPLSVMVAFKLSFFPRKDLSAAVALVRDGKGASTKSPVFTGILQLRNTGDAGTGAHIDWAYAIPEHGCVRGER